MICSVRYSTKEIIFDAGAEQQYHMQSANSILCVDRGFGQVLMCISIYFYVAQQMFPHFARRLEKFAHDCERSR